MQLHPQQISPGENFDLFYFIRNHTDLTTYYVQAKVYDARTGALLATQNLTQASTNGRLFLATLQAPGDPQALGRNIVSIATVYTDSGYTTKSTDYEEQEQYFLIRAELPFLAGGGVDYRTLREIMQEEVDRGIKAIPPPPAPQEVPYDTLYGAIGALTREINRIPKEAADDTAILEKLDEVLTAIGALPEKLRVDLTPFVMAVRSIDDNLSADRTEDSSREQRLIDAIHRTGAVIAKQITDELSGAIDNHEFTLPSVVVRPGGAPPPAPAPTPFDPSILHA
jgi:hypothetical protein